MLFFTLYIVHNYQINVYVYWWPLKNDKALYTGDTHIFCILTGTFTILKCFISQCICIDLLTYYSNYKYSLL